MAKQPHIESKLKRLAVRNERIFKRFKEFDTATYKLEYILEQLANDFCLAPGTVYEIIRKESNKK